MNSFKTHTDAERDGLKLYGLETRKPRQLSDNFVHGMRYANRVHLERVGREERESAVRLAGQEIQKIIAQWNYEVHGDRQRYIVKGAGYAPETIAEFKTGLELLRKAYIYAQRIQTELDKPTHD